MNRTAKYGLLTLAATLAGFPLGYRHAQRTVGVGASLASQFLALSQYKALANLQYKEADTAHSTQAQLDLVHFMQQLEGRQAIADRPRFDYDRARALMHLALRAQQDGNDEEFQSYLHDAQRSLDDVDQKWPSEETMRTFIAATDKHSKD
jgi:hypothetical protein